MPAASRLEMLHKDLRNNSPLRVKLTSIAKSRDRGIETEEERPTDGDRETEREGGRAEAQHGWKRCNRAYCSNTQSCSAPNMLVMAGICVQASANMDQPAQHESTLPAPCPDLLLWLPQEIGSPHQSSAWEYFLHIYKRKRYFILSEL